MSGKTTPILLAVLAVALAVAPFVMPSYGLVLGFGLFVAAGLALAWNLVGGIAGQFALGHAMYVGVGAYAVALTTSEGGWPLPVALATAAFVSAALAAVSAALFLRMRAAYFSVATMGLSLACMAWAVTSSALGAAAGVTLPGDLPVTDRGLFWAAGALMLATLALTAWLVRTPFGLSLMAVRDDEEAAAECGVNPLQIKCSVMAISGALAGTFGGLVVLQKQMVEPMSAFSMSWTISMIMMSVIGGLGSVWGPLWGALLVYGTQQLLEDLATWNLLITALVLIAVIRLAPGGLVDLAGRAMRAWRGQRTAGAVPAASGVTAVPTPPPTAVSPPSTSTQGIP
jgi:branched-chain amino acid transport system permease protein